MSHGRTPAAPEFPKSPDHCRLREALRVAAEELDAVHFARCDYMLSGAPEAAADLAAVRAMLARYGAG